MTSIRQDPIILGQDQTHDDDDQSPGTAQPVSQSEIEELLYNEEIPADERLARLRQFRSELREQESADFGDDDPRSMIGEIELAIGRLEDNGTMGEAQQDIDPADHRETLSPDDDVREAIEEADEASVADDIGGGPTEDDGLEQDDILPDERDNRLH